MSEKNIFNQLLPFSLSIVIILLDQITKHIIDLNIKIGEIIEVIGDFLWIVHIRNNALAFGLGRNLEEPYLSIISIILPIIVLFILFFGYFKLKDITKLQKWCLAVAIGGGIGNLIDRIFRPEGVIDFISVNVYGFLGFRRWPAFNVADSALVIMVILLFISVILTEKKRKSDE